MNLKYRVQNHGFAGEGKTRLELAGVDGTEGNLSVTRTNAEAAKFPVGALVTVKVSVGE